MPSHNLAAGKKRRADGPPAIRSAPKRFKPDIAVQNGQPGEVNIANFVKAREFEIKALESNMKAMRKSLSSRAFQALPRHLRRRTASHNVKRVPRRLRKRATKEMVDDNTTPVSKRTRTPSRKLRLRLATAKSLNKRNQTSRKSRQKKKESSAKGKEAEKEQDPEKQVSITRVPKIKKNTLLKPPTATSKYKRRQVNKTWLPTHLWHAKRAHLTRPTEPLWRLAIPLRPTEKSYRPTHRAARARGCIAWDTSYMSSVACLGTEHTLTNLLEALGFGAVNDRGGKLKRWKSGGRFAEGYVHETGSSKRLLGPVMVLWVPVEKSRPSDATQAAEGDGIEATTKKSKTKLDRRLFIRVHPSIFKDFWIELLRAAKMQKPQVLVEDLRFEIGSIHITGPASTESLLGVVRPRHDPGEADVAAKTWISLAGLNNPGSLPNNAVLAFDIIDPRLSHPTKQVKVPSDQQSFDRLTELMVMWPLDEKPSAMTLASCQNRWIAATKLPPQKSINRRRAEAGAGNAVPIIERDPPIPVVLLAHRAPGGDSTAQGSWTVLLPWCCVDAVWRSLQYYPISSGSTPRFGGLYQTQQLAFEHMTPWFPADLPGTEAGKAWERTESERRFNTWLRRPPGRKLQWDMVDIGLGRKGELGRGWMCDWEYLCNDTGPSQEQAPPVKDSDQDAGDNDDNRRRRNTSSPESTPEPEATKISSQAGFYQLPPLEAAVTLDPLRSKRKAHTKLSETPALATVRIRLLTKGTPQAGARIYRLPAAPKAVQSDLPTATPPLRAPTQTSMPPPSLPASAEVHTSTNPATSTSSAPPAAQRTPLPPPSTQSDFSVLRNGLSSSATLSLREKWLSLVPSAADSSKALTATNPKAASYYHPDSKEAYALSKINVFPPKASDELIAKFSTYPSEEQIAEFNDQQLLRELLKNDAVSLTSDGKRVQWDVNKGLVECPDKEDLIGFVTSGGYNLQQGRGTAVGALWVQRVREGWLREDEEGGSAHADLGASDAMEVGRQEGARATSAASGRGKKQLQRGNGRNTINGSVKSDKNKAASAAEQARAKKVKERTLCIVRNAGSGVGRLGWWEVCE